MSVNKKKQLTKFPLPLYNYGISKTNTSIYS